MSELLRRPEYVHLLLNPLPIYGLLMSALALALALAIGGRRSLAGALVLVLIASVATAPVVYFGERGYDRVAATTDADGEHWLEEHEERAEKAAPLLYATAALALVALLAPLRFPRAGRWLAALTLAAALASLGAGAWVARAGGRIRHPELREGTTGRTPSRPPGPASAGEPGPREPPRGEAGVGRRAWT